MVINGMEAEYLGVVGFRAPWNAYENDIFDDLWGTPDGKRFVERYIQADIVEYDWIKHGFIWYEEEIKKHESQANDKAYAEWCLENNWLRMDDQAYEYVTGENIKDDPDYWGPFEV